MAQVESSYAGGAWIADLCADALELWARTHLAEESEPSIESLHRVSEVLDTFLDARFYTEDQYNLVCRVLTLDVENALRRKLRESLGVKE